MKSNKSYFLFYDGKQYFRIENGPYGFHMPPFYSCDFLPAVKREVENIRIRGGGDFKLDKTNLVVEYPYD